MQQEITSQNDNFPPCFVSKHSIQCLVNIQPTQNAVWISCNMFTDNLISCLCALNGTFPIQNCIYFLLEHLLAFLSHDCLTTDVLDKHLWSFNIDSYYFDDTISKEVSVYSYLLTCDSWFISLARWVIKPFIENYTLLTNVSCRKFFYNNWTWDYCYLTVYWLRHNMAALITV